jgi:WD40 repeat protein
MQGIKSAVYSVAFSPDGTLIASGGFDGSVTIHDAQSGQVKVDFVPVPLPHNE